MEDTKKVSSEWKEVRLGELCNVKGGKRLPKGEKLQSFPTSHPYIRIRDLNNSKNIEVDSSYEYITKNVYDKISRYITNEGDILISIVGTIGLIAKVGKSLDGANLTENCVKLIDLKEISVEFLYYFLTSCYGKNEIDKGIVGAVQAKLPIKNIKDISIKLPPLHEQEKIASILKSLDDKIELNNQMNQTLEEMAQDIFKEWFVEFNFPITPNFCSSPLLKGEGGKILRYKDNGGEMVDSELGEIPEGWRVEGLGKAFDVTMGQSPKGSSYNENKKGSVFYQGRTDFNFRFPSNRIFTTEPKRMAKQLDVLLSVRAPVGDVNVATEECCIGRGIAAITSTKTSFLLYTMKNLSQKFKMFDNEGTVFGSINKKGLEELKIIVPSDEILNLFEGIVSSIDTFIFNNSKEIETLINIRDTLLPKLMSGEVRV